MKANKRDILALFLFILISFIIYLPVVDHYFVSDDFKVLYRVCVEQIIFIKRFFRPLSDISIWMNYRLGGLNPVIFNSFNILIHGINCWLVFLTCLYVGKQFDPAGRKQFAILSSVLFLCYPFHNEAIVWLLGRGASMACLFALCAVISWYRIRKNSLKTAAVCFCYFMSMTAFESTMLFPLLFVLLLMFEKTDRRSIARWSLALIVTLALHILLRYQVSGSIFGSYGGDFFHSGLKTYSPNILKVAGRLILPPAHHAILFMSVFIVLTAVLLLWLYIRMGQIKQHPVFTMMLFLAGMLSVACLVPVITGVSTQTSESDRMLYFPSVFVCMIVGAFIAFGIRNRGNKILVSSLVMIYSLFFLERNNANWNKASAITKTVVARMIGSAGSGKTGGRIYFLNIPNEIEGAYVFRQGFPDAIRLYGLDSASFMTVNYLPRQDLEKMKEKLVLNQGKAVMALPPDIIMRLDSSGCRQVYDHGELKVACHPDDELYFWNQDELEKISCCVPQVPG